MKILAFGAHPDDVEFGCAPVLIQEAQRGHQVRILVASRGEAASSGTAEEREREAREAANVIGASLDFLELGGDCHLESTPAAAIAVASEIRKFQPQVVLAPRLVENQHPDHAALGRMARDGARLARYGGLEELRGLAPHAITHLLFYSITEIFGDAPHLLIDVSPSHTLWLQAMECHRSQMQTRAYVDLVSARARATGAAIGVDYAVGLWANDPLRVDSLANLPLTARYF